VLWRESNDLEQLLHRCLDLLVGQGLLQPECGADDRPDIVSRVQRGVRILEDHLDIATQRPHGPRAQLRDIRSIEIDAAARRIEQLGHQLAHSGLSAA